MRRQIKNPYKVNFKFYFILLGISIGLMVLGILIGMSIFAEVIKNLAYGCIASTIVALFIEIGTVSENNKKFSEHYNAAYGDLQFMILRYLELWAEFCYISDGTKGYKEEKKKWKDWYKLSKTMYTSASKEERDSMDVLLIECLLKPALNDINNSIQSLISQKYLLEVNDLYSCDLDLIIKNFEFEFRCAKREIDSSTTMANLWSSFDALNKDFINYIDEWSDISYYNELQMGPYYNFGGSEYAKAVLAINLRKKKGDK